MFLRLGNLNIHGLTNDGYTYLRVELMDHDCIWKFAEYSNFYVESKSSKYRLHVNGYSGNAGMYTHKHILFLYSFLSLSDSVCMSVSLSVHPHIYSLSIPFSLSLTLSVSLSVFFFFFLPPPSLSLSLYNLIKENLS